MYKSTVLNLVWEISPDESTAWNESAVPPNAVKVEQPESQAALINRSLFLVVPLIAAGCTFVVYCKKKKIFDVSRAGEADKIVGCAASYKIHEQIKGSELYMYEKLGHAVYEEADDFNKRVFDFIVR